MYKEWITSKIVWIKEIRQRDRKKQKAKCLFMGNLNLSTNLILKGIIIINVGLFQ